MRYRYDVMRWRGTEVEYSTGDYDRAVLWLAQQGFVKKCGEIFWDTVSDDWEQYYVIHKVKE